MSSRKVDEPLAGARAPFARWSQVRAGTALVAIFPIMLVSTTAAASPAGMLHDEATGLQVAPPVVTWEEVVLESAVNTRRQLGFPAAPTYVSDLQGSLADVGTEAIGLPLTAAELAEVERREATYTVFHESLEAKLRARDDFGGIYIDQHAGGKVVVLTTGDAEELATQVQRAVPTIDDDVVVREVEFSAAQLRLAKDRLTRESEARFGGIPVLAVGVDFERTAIIVRVPRDRIDDARLYAQAASDAIEGITVRVEGGEENVGDVCTSRTNCYSPLKPGVRITSGQAICTMGFHIVGSGNHFLTSGHCSGSAWSHGGYGTVGIQTGTLYPGGGFDIKRVSMATAQQTTGVYGSSPSSTYWVSSSAWPVQGNTVRGSMGRSNALYTGVVEIASMNYRLSDCSCYLGGGRHNLPRMGGDSGSPIFSSGLAIGIHSSSGGHFATLQYALNHWNASLP